MLNTPHTHLQHNALGRLRFFSGLGVKDVQSLQSAFSIVFLAFLAVIASSSILYFYTLDAVESDIREYMGGIARAGANSIDGDLHATFTSRTQESSKPYTSQIARLNEVWKLFPAVKYIYSCILKDGKVYFILDPTPEGKHIDGVDPKAHIMDEYPEADDDLKKALSEHKAVFNSKPYADRWGKFVSAYVPFYNSRNEFAGVIGVDLDAHDYVSRINRVRNTAILCILIGFGISCSIGLILYRQGQRIRGMTESLERTNSELLQLASAARRATQEKSLFLANITHDLRTPMSGILGMAYLLRDTRLDDVQKEYIDTINHSAENLLLLINDVLDMSKIEAGELILEKAPFDMKEAFIRTINILKPLAHNKGISLISHMDPAIPRQLMGDPRRFSQLITNLVGNAIKFTDKGRVEATLRYDTVQGMIYCEVKDTGIGIPEHKRDAIFEKFVQGDVSITQKYGGTGLGLAITKQIVVLLGGTIGYESKEQEGSRFWFTLPALPPLTREVTSDEETVCHVAGNRIHAHHARILLADDHPVNRMFLRKLLLKFGFLTIEEVENGLQLMQRLDQHYDVIFMDCKMPEQDGYETSRLIRQKEKNEGGQSHIPIIALTANALSGDREACIEAGMDEYLSKPIQPELFKLLLSRWFILPEIHTLADTASVPYDLATPIDFSRLDMITDSDADKKMFIGLFFRLSKEHIDIMEGSKRNDEFQRWKHAAHSLKGASANLGMKTLEELCGRAEKGQDLGYATRSILMEHIKGEILRIRHYIESIAPELLEEEM